MPSPGLRTAKRPRKKKDGDECVLLIEADADVAAEIFAALNSATEEQFHVEWVTELSSGIERLRKGGVGAVVLDLTLPDSHGVESFDKLFQASARVPILILSEADAEEMARQAAHRGAHDYLAKNQSVGYRLRGVVRTMIERRTAEAAVKALVLQNEVAKLTLDAIEEAVLRTDINGGTPDRVVPERSAGSSHCERAPDYQGR
jgi:DNA-binding response OmpR family regulator